MNARIKNSRTGAAARLCAKKKCADTLIESEKKYRAIAENTIDVIYQTDRKGFVTYCSPSVRQMSGYSAREVIGTHIKTYVAPDFLPRIIKDMGRVLRGKILRNVNAVMLRKNRSRVPVEINGAPLTGNGRVVGMQGVIRDVSARTEAEQKIKETEERYKKLLYTSPDSIVLTDLDFNIILANKRTAEQIGARSPEKMTGTSTLKYVRPVDIPAIRAYGKTVLKEGAVKGATFDMKRESGELFPVEMNVSLFRDADNKPAGFIVVTRDVTGRKKMEEALKASNTELALFNEMDTVFLRCHGDDMYGEILSLLSRTFSADCGLFGYIENGRDFVVPSLPKPLLREYGIETLPLRLKVKKRRPSVFTLTLTGKKAVHLKEPFRLPTGNIRISEALSAPILFSGKTIGLVTLARKSGTFADGDLKKLERLAQHLAPTLNARLEKQKQEAENQKMIEELINAQKIESLGIMAGGLAHDFNNMLAGIMGNLSILAADVPKAKKDWHEMINEAIEATENSRCLAQQLITFARGGGPAKKALDAGGLIKKASLFAARGSACAPKFSIQKDLWRAHGDEAQLSQVIHNLILNSVQAMPHGGNIDITASNEFVAGGPAGPMGKGRYIKLSVRDRGMGIPPENQKKIFEPFFSTKAHGRGLGLTMAYSIIKRHDGYITMQSTPGKGACFAIYLPAAPRAKAGIPAAKAAGGVIGGTGRMLLIEDDAAMARTLARMLKHLGYDPVTAGNGEKALKVYAGAVKTGRPFKAVIMDLVIPGGMDGKETVKQLKDLYPEAKVIASSGYSDDPVMSDHTAYGFDAVLAKPYKFSDLASTLSALLGKKNAT